VVVTDYDIRKHLEKEKSVYPLKIRILWLVSLLLFMRMKRHFLY